MFIENELAGYGLQMESDYFSYRGGNFRNVIGKLGDPSSKPAIVVGAHLIRYKVLQEPTITPAALRFCWKQLGFSRRPACVHRSYSVLFSSRSSI
jgi:hypothetical protein